MAICDSKFARDTAVVQTAEFVWQGHFSADWCVGPVPNGGYIMAIGARALSEALPHKDPLTISAFYIDRTEVGPVSCEVEILRSGGSTSHGVVRLIQNGKLKVQLTAAYCELHHLRGETRVLEAAPEIPPFEHCAYLPAPQEISMAEQVVQKVVPGQERSLMGTPDGSGCWLGWIDFKDTTEIDLFALLLLSDGFPPPAFTLYGATSWVPTLDLTVQLRAKPKPGPIQCRFQTRMMTKGVMEEDGALWDSSGQIVALSRQTAKFRLPT